MELGHGYVRREGSIHFLGGGKTGEGADLTRIDRPSQSLLKKFDDWQFGPFQTAEGIDPNTFTVLSEEYTKDKSRVYFKIVSPGIFLVTVLEDADPATFKVLARNVAKDQDHVWYYNTIQAAADPNTVKLVDGERVFKDRNSVFYGYKLISGADSASFRHLGSAYYSDKRRVYWSGEPIMQADPSSFKVLGDSFIAKDGARVYRSGKPMAGLDSGSVELILHEPMGYQVLSDKSGVHLNHLTFPRSKPGKVKVIDRQTIQAGSLIHLVNSSQYTPVTLYKQEGKLFAEAPGYDPGTWKTLGLIIAEVKPAGLKIVRSDSVPDWQVQALRNPDLIRRMNAAGKLLR
ncbi:MAG: DKNYY domain-containing protein [Akkermansiaceae bacterium]